MSWPGLGPTQTQHLWRWTDTAAALMAPVTEARRQVGGSHAESVDTREVWVIWVRSMSSSSSSFVHGIV
eukprot:7826830-Pyramimonas_sp.AAC.1